MIQFQVRLDSMTLDNISSICNLRGCRYLTIAYLHNTLTISAITPEYMMVLVDVPSTEISEDFSIRVPISAIKPLLWTGYLHFKLDTSLVISLVYNSRVQSRVKLPLELDFEQEILKNTLDAYEMSKTSGILDLHSLIALKEAAAFSKQGIQVENKLAFVSAGGFIVYMPVNFDFKCIMSKECLSSMLSFIRSSRDLRMFDVQGYHSITSGTLIFSWRKSRLFSPTDYDTFSSMQPNSEFRCDFTAVRQIARAIPASRTKTYKSTLNLESNYLQIEIGVHETFLATFKSDVIFKNEDETSLSMSLPYSVLRTVLSVGSLEWSNILISVYDTCIAFNSGDITIVMIKGD